MSNAALKNPAPESPAPTRSVLKRTAIMDAATTVFLQHGYLGTSMDQIAALAAVSKQTVYKHFADKEQLFRAIILSTADKIGAYFQSMAEQPLDDPEDLAESLGLLSRQSVAFLMQPELLRLRRLVIAEANRFPELGRRWYQLGPEKGLATLVSYLEMAADLGLLALDDPHLAASHLYWLILSIPLNRNMLCGDGERFTEAELNHFADAGVRVFLTAYGRPEKG